MRFEALNKLYKQKAWMKSKINGSPDFPPNGEKTGTSVCTNVSVLDECLYKFPVNPAAWKIHNLF